MTKQADATRATLRPGTAGWAASGASGAFQTDRDWLAFHPQPGKPSFLLPPGAVDAHCHVFGPAEHFPYAPGRRYTPCDAPKEKLWALRDHLGFERSVIVQATCHGTDNRALVDALLDAEGRARGVATLPRGVGDEELRALHAAGVRGVRFNFLKRLADAVAPAVLREIAERIRPLGWHVVLYFEAQDLPQLYPLIASLPTIVVVDHMGRPDVSKPVDGPQFERFVRLMREHGNVWSKVSCPERLSASGPPHYTDVVPFAQRLIEAFPERVLWGTDWPHPNMKSHMPDDGALVDLIPTLAPGAALQHRLLVSNPASLYWEA